jgi:pimeloyl-ACP methyl ester carboxylesterase
MPCADQAQCPAAAAPLTLADALARCQREAMRGICDTGRYRCAYFSWGEGPPLVLLPGMAEVPQNFIPLMARLAGRFRCVSYQLPAGGDDGARLGRITHADYVADLLALLNHLGIRQTYLFGSSFGSTVVLAALRQQPERFPRAVLQGGFAQRTLAPAELLLASVARWWPGRMRHLPLRLGVARRCHGEPFAGCPPEVWDYFLTQTGALPITAVAHRAVLLHRIDLRALLGEVRQPVLLVCGDRDPLVGRACEEVLRAGLPSAGRVEVNRCGHFPYLTHPDLLAALVGDFLTPPRAV